MSYLLLVSFSEIASYAGYVLLAVLILLLMITVHELGHYAAGKILRFGIEEFAIGFGPAVFKRKKKSGEVFSIRALPLGGFCAFKGEDKEDPDPETFNAKEPWKRIIVLVSGAFMNYILALLIIVTMFGFYGQPAYVTSVLTDDSGYTQEVSFMQNDIILSANGKNVYLITDVMSSIEGKTAGEDVEFVVRRKGKDVKTTVRLREDAVFENVEDYRPLYAALGIDYDNAGIRTTFVKFGFFQVIGRSFEYSFKLAGTVFTVLGQLLTGRLGVSSLGGTVTMITTTAQAVQTGGFRYLLNIASFIGVNLAVFNLLPIPALDGARVLFTLIEWIRKKPVNRKVEAVIHTVGLVALLLFSVIVDLQRCF